jgi:hypothetical protein
LEKEALIQLPPLSEKDTVVELADVFSQLLSEQGRCDELRRRSKAVVAENIGATERTIKLISPLLKAAAVSSLHDQQNIPEQVRPE